jgi:hypothetical protein
MSELRDAIAQIQQVIGQLEGIRQAPIDPPEQMAVFPFAVCYPTSGVWKPAPLPGKTGLHNVVVEIHVARENNLGNAIETALKYSELVPNVLFKGIQNGTFTEFQTFGEITYIFGPLGWNGVPTIGWRFTLNQLKQQSNVT